MNDTIYWAVKLDGASKALLLNKHPPIHGNVFAEHMTIVFKPSDLEEADLELVLGLTCPITVIGEAHDGNGQAVMVECDKLKSILPSTPHITISCAHGTKPVYSKTLLQAGFNPIAPFALVGKIAKFTKRGWIDDRHSP